MKIPQNETTIPCIDSQSIDHQTKEHTLSTGQYSVYFPKTFPPQSQEVIIILCNCPDHRTAEKLANALVEKRLAACVNILSPVQSVYHWEDKIQKSIEIPIMIKTTASCYSAIQTEIVSQHPYQTPEIIAWQLMGLETYFDWVRSNVKTPSG